jgi:hypothetical protein
MRSCCDLARFGAVMEGSPGLNKLEGNYFDRHVRTAYIQTEESAAETLVCFAILAGSYTNELTTHTQRSQGLLPIKKGDFFPLFWRAWTSTFTEKLILKSFESTGIWSTERDVILKRFCTKTLDKADQPKSSPVLAEKN